MSQSANSPRIIGRRHLALVSVMGLTALGLLAQPLDGRAANPTSPGFAHYAVSTTLAGGEPLVSVAPDGKGGTDLVYTSHEGTTHLFKDGLGNPTNACATGDPSSPSSLPSGFLCSYRNEVNVWTSNDQGHTWLQTTVGPSGVTSPYGQGFSDPDLATDEGGYVYNTGINLATDSVFATHDGGKTFPIGNNQCHGGDRPWLAGGVSGEVFLATDTTIDPNPNATAGHELFHGVITGAAPAQTLVCSGANGLPDPAGTSDGIHDYGTSSAPLGGSYSAAGKVFYDHNNLGDGYHGSLIDPALFSNPSGGGVGISVLKNAAAAFGGSTAGFKQFEVPGTNGTFAHWPSIAIDAKDVVYLTWDSDTTDANGLNNAIKLSTIDLKAVNPVFTTPITITQPGASVLWPWVTVPTTAAGAGNASVVWYQYDRVTNPDAGVGNVFLYESNVFSGVPTTPVNTFNAPIHNGGLCQTGTTCVATGQDRRLGDFFTNAVDQNGCVMIATGETMTQPTAATSRPVFVQQTSGTSLTGLDCAQLPTNVPEAPVAALLLLGAAGASAAVTLARRRRPATA